jgi:GAF domain-containing protein
MSTPSSTRGPYREPALLAAFIDIADTMVVDYDVLDLLHRLCRHSVKLLDVAAAGLLATSGNGDLRLLASSDERARMVELFELQAGAESPCRDCLRTRQPVAAVDITRFSDRWPKFVEHALAQGFRTVYAQPVRLRTQIIGALNLFRSGHTPLPAADVDLGQALADIAAIAIVQERALAHSEALVEQLQGALNSRVVIEQAKGVLAQAGRISMDSAFGALRNYARGHNRLLSELARAVTTDNDQARLVLGEGRDEHG